METKKRVKYIDVARGIAIICIILGHLGISNIDKVVFTFHVPIFFFITGYFIDDSLSMDEFIKKKIKTLIIPYICTCLVIILIATLKNMCFYGTEIASKTAMDWIMASLYGSGVNYDGGIYYVKAIGAIWFLLATFFGSVFLKGTLNMKRYTRIATILFLFVIGYKSYEIFLIPFSIQPGCCATIFMYIGYLIKDIKRGIKEVSVEVKVVFTILAILLWFYFIKTFEGFFLVECYFGRGIIDILGCICGCYIIILISKFIGKYLRIISNALAFIGKYSLYVLCIHIVELNLIPWWNIAENSMLQINSANIKMLVIIVAKFMLIISATVILSKFNLTRKLFGYSKINQ